MYTKDQINSFKIEIVATSLANTDTHDRVVREAHWRMVASKDELRGKYYQNTTLPDPSSEFINYEDLTAEDIISFLSLTQDEILYYEEKALAEINNLFPEESENASTKTEVHEITSWV